MNAKREAKERITERWREVARAARDEMGWTNKILAEHAGVGADQVTRILGEGTARPTKSSKDVPPIAAALGIPTPVALEAQHIAAQNELCQLAVELEERWPDDYEKVVEKVRDLVKVNRWKSA